MGVHTYIYIYVRVYIYIYIYAYVYIYIYIYIYIYGVLGILIIQVVGIPPRVCTCPRPHPK